MPTYDPNSLEGYSLVRAEEGWGSKGNFGLKIFVKDSERDKIDIPVNRHGKKEKFDTDGDWKVIDDAARILKAGLRAQTERLKPDFEEKKAENKKYYAGLFEKAGITAIYMQELPNGYCPEEGKWCCLTQPWFKVTTPFGHIKIGWRKSVINLDWSESDIKKSGADLFPNEDVTKGGQYSDDNTQFIHCWGPEKAIEYLKKLKEESQ
jgi:hypothetical protein